MGFVATKTPYGHFRCPTDSFQSASLLKTSLNILLRTSPRDPINRAQKCSAIPTQNATTASPTANTKHKKVQFNSSTRSAKAVSEFSIQQAIRSAKFLAPRRRPTTYLFWRRYAHEYRDRGYLHCRSYRRYTTVAAGASPEGTAAAHHSARVRQDRRQCAVEQLDY